MNDVLFVLWCMAIVERAAPVPRGRIRHYIPAGFTEMVEEQTGEQK